MKAKQIVILYVDKAILVAMAVLFLYAVYAGFLTGAPEERQLREEIPRSMDKLEKNLAESTPPPLPVMKDAEMVSQRYAHLRVVEPYRRYVLFKPAPIQVGTYRLVKGTPFTMTVIGVQITRVRDILDAEAVKAGAPEPMDPDNPYAGTQIKLQPLKATSQSGTLMTMTDVDGLVYEARLVVFDAAPKEKPLPPKEVDVKVCMGKPLLKMRWDNPQPLPRGVAETVGFWVYRKLAGRPDSSYQLLNEQKPAAPNEEEKQRIREEFRLVPKPEAGAATVVAPAAEGGVVDAVVVEASTPKRPLTPEQPKEEPDVALFVDRACEPGESYVYKVVSVDAEVNRKRNASDPVVAAAVRVPLEVQFWLSSVVGRAAHIRVQRIDYEMDRWDETTFFVAPGMKIGRERAVRTRDTGSNRTKNVDFSTQAVLVAAFRQAQVYTPKLVARPAPGSYKVRSEPVLDVKTDDMVIVMTQKGQQLDILFRGKPPAQPAAAAPRGEARTPRTEGPRPGEPGPDAR